MPTSSPLSWIPFKNGWRTTSLRSGSEYTIMPDTIGGGWVLSVWDESKDDPEPLQTFPDAETARACADRIDLTAED